MEPSKSFLENLPCSLLERVCRYLTLKDLLNLRFTNRQLFYLIQSFCMRIKIVIGASRNASYTNMRMVKPINFAKEIEKMENLRSIFSTNNWRVFKVTLNLTKTQKTDQKVQDDMTTKLYSLLGTCSQTLISLHIEATASYDNGPFQELRPFQLISICPNLEILHLNGRKMTKLNFSESHSPRVEKEGPNRFETKLKCLKLEHIEPCGLANLIEASPLLEKLSVLFYGDFPPIDYATFHIWHDANDGKEFEAQRGKPQLLCNLREVSVIGLMPINMPDLIALAPNISHLQLNLEGLDEENKERAYLAETLPLIMSLLNPNKISCLNLTTLEKDHFLALSKFQLLSTLSLRLDSDMIKSLAVFIESSSLGLEKLRLIISTAAYRDEGSTQRMLNEKDLHHLIDAIAKQNKHSLISFEIEFFNYPGDFFCTSNLCLTSPMTHLLAACHKLEWLQFHKVFYTSKAAITQLREKVASNAECKESLLNFQQ